MSKARQHLWHPFASMANVNGPQAVVTRGEGSWIEDAGGRKYLDATASLWCCNVGYGRDELVDAAAIQMRKMPAYHLFGGLYATEPAIELADRLAGLAPVEDAAVFLTNGGSDSVDTACKMARRYWQVRGEPQRTVVVARSNAYHGMNAYGTTLAGISVNAVGWGDLVANVVHVPHDDAEALERVIAENGDRIAAFIGEPVLGTGGVIPPKDGYWADIQRICRANGVLLIADEVITGFGRTGPWFASQRFGIDPDLVTCAKGVTSGYLPLGAVLAGPRVREVLWSEQAGLFRHGYTYSGHATACAVALRNLALIEEEGLRDNVGKLEPVLAAAVDSLLDIPLVAETRHIGLLGAVQISAEACAATPGLVDGLVRTIREEHGVLVRALMGHSIQISPPFVVTENEINLIVQAIRGALEPIRATAGAVAM